MDRLRDSLLVSLTYLVSSRSVLGEEKVDSAKAAL